jgi:hypothetical protein
VIATDSERLGVQMTDLADYASVQVCYMADQIRRASGRTFRPPSSSGRGRLTASVEGLLEAQTGAPSQLAPGQVGPHDYLLLAGLVGHRAATVRPRCGIAIPLVWMKQAGLI